MVICLERGADLHMAQLMPLQLTVSCFSKIQIGFTFLVPAHPGSPGKRRLNGCVCDSENSCLEQKNAWSRLALILLRLYDISLNLRKVIKIVATICHILKVKCTKFDFSCGFAPHPAERDYSSPRHPLAGFKGAHF